MNNLAIISLLLTAVVAPAQDGAKQAQQIEKLRDAATTPAAKAEILGSMSYSTSLPDSPEFLKLIADLSAHESVSVRAGAVRIISVLGPKAKSIQSALVKRLGDPELMAVVTSPQGLGFLANVPEILSKNGPEIVPELQAILEDAKNTPERRAEAAKTIGLIGRPAKAAMPTLKTVVGEKAPLGVNAAVAYLQCGGKVADVLPMLRAALKDPDANLRYQALRALRSVPGSAEHFADEIVSLASDEQSKTRTMAAAMAAQLGERGKAAVPAIVKMLTSQVREERWEAGRALADFGPLAEESLPVLIKQLDSLEPVSPNSILDALGRMGPKAKSAVPRLLSLAKDTESKHQHLTAESYIALVKIGAEPDEVIPILTKALADRTPHSPKPEHALKALGLYGTKAKSAVPAIHQLLERTTRLNALWAFAALARIEGKSGGESVNAIIAIWDESAAVKSPFDVTEYVAIKALAYIGSEARPARGRLVRVLVKHEGKGIGTMESTVEALRNFKQDAGFITDELAPLLLLNETNGGFYSSDLVRIIDMLGSFGPKAAVAVPNLKKLLEHQDAEVVYASEKALKSIAAETK